MTAVIDVIASAVVGVVVAHQTDNFFVSGLVVLHMLIHHCNAVVTYPPTDKLVSLCRTNDVRKKEGSMVVATQATKE